MSHIVRKSTEDIVQSCSDSMNPYFHINKSFSHKYEPCRRVSVCEAPPEFVQWPQSVARPAGGSAVFSCTASGVPEPHLIWLKNGKLLMPSGNVKLTNGNT